MVSLDSSYACVCESAIAACCRAACSTPGYINRDRCASPNPERRDQGPCDCARSKLRWNVGCVFALSVGDDLGGIYEMFCHEPDLHFIGPNNTAHQQIIGAVIAPPGGFPGRCPGFHQDDFVGGKQA